MKTTSMTEIRTLVSVVVPGDGAQTLTEAIVRAIELAEEEAVTRLATKSDLAELKVDLVRWMFGAGITLTAVIVGAVYFIVNLKH